GDRGMPLYPDMPTYDPNASNNYAPKPDVHGYEPTIPAQISYTVMKNVFLRVDPEIGVFIRHLEGHLEAKRQGDPVIFDDVRSFVTHVYRAELEIDQENISRLKNKFTFNFPDSPIKEIQIQFTPGRVSMSGKMKQVIWVPFSMEGVIVPTPEGKLQLIPDSIKVSGIPMKSMMDLIGLTTSKLLSVPAERGVEFKGNNVVLDCQKLFPPPQLNGRVVGAQILQGKLKLIFDSPQRVPPRTPPDMGMPNYLHIYGGKALIMNELHRGAELQMIDQNPSNPFDFYLAGYLAHLKAGYVKVANDAGTLLALMPDYTELGRKEVWDGYPGGKPQLRPPTTGYGAPTSYPTTGYGQGGYGGYGNQGYVSYSTFAAQAAQPRR
ncbi:MAG TPA: hypothetical protein V6D23_20550, partial [Candidatus Obscuribacterales bacterium]